MSKQKLGQIMHWLGYAAGGAAALVAAKHPAILALLAVGAGLFFLGRALEKSV